MKDVVKAIRREIADVRKGSAHKNPGRFAPEKLHKTIHRFMK